MTSVQCPRRGRTRIFAVLLPAWLTACTGGGDSAPPPTGVTAAVGDGRVTLSWTTAPGVQYWVFGAADQSVTTSNWAKLARPLVIVRAGTPQTLCGLLNDVGYWFTINGRTDDGPGGDGSPVIGAQPRSAGLTWTPGPAAASPINGIGFATLTTCSNIGTRSADGLFAMVGNAGLILTSTDGANWTNQSIADPSINLNAVTGYAVQLNTTANPRGLRMVAVGDGGISAVSLENEAWSVTRAADAGHPNMRAIGRIGQKLVAVGDNGTVETSNDGVSWFPQISGTTESLHGVVFGDGAFIAVGTNGATGVSGNGDQWVFTRLGTPTLRAIAFGNFDANAGNNDVLAITTYVAVGDGGTFAVSNDNGSTWRTGVVPGAADLIGINYTTVFTAVDRNGLVFRSRNGVDWAQIGTTGVAPVSAVGGSDFAVLVGAQGGQSALSQ